MNVSYFLIVFIAIYFQCIFVVVEISCINIKSEDVYKTFLQFKTNLSKDSGTNLHTKLLSSVERMLTENVNGKHVVVKRETNAQPEEIIKDGYLENILQAQTTQKTLKYRPRRRQRLKSKTKAVNNMKKMKSVFKERKKLTTRPQKKLAKNINSPVNFEKEISKISSGKIKSNENPSTTMKKELERKGKRVRHLSKKLKKRRKHKTNLKPYYTEKIEKNSALKNTEAKNSAGDFSENKNDTSVNCSVCRIETNNSITVNCTFCKEEFNISQSLCATCMLSEIRKDINFSRTCTNTNCSFYENGKHNCTDCIQTFKSDNETTVVCCDSDWESMNSKEIDCANCSKEDTENSKTFPKKASDIERLESERAKTKREKVESLISDCPSCHRRTIQEVEAARIVMFRDQLIKQLHLEDSAEKPGYRTIPRIPRDLLNSVQDDQPEDDDESGFGRVEQTIIPGIDMGKQNCFPTMHSTGCYSFLLKGNIKGKIASAVVMVYKTRDRFDAASQSFVLYDLDRSKQNKLKRSSLVSRLDTKVREGWISLNATLAVERWVIKEKVQEMVAIRCKTCDRRNYRALFGWKERYQPLLVIKYDKGSSKSRNKRSADCDPQTNCCKRPLTVDFHALMLPSIISPDTASIGYCYGACERQEQSLYYHTVLKQYYRLHTDNISRSLRTQLIPCCAPIVLKHLPVSVMRNSSVETQVLRNVIVDTCACV